MSKRKAKNPASSAARVIAPVVKCEPFEVTEVGETERGTGGFGSSGV